MRKFKLIKEYPGSPELGTEVEKQAKTQTYYHIYNDRKFGVLTEHVENNPEYWKEVVEHIYYMVSLIDMGFHNAWEPIRVEAIKYDTDTKKYFSTEEGARDFILLHKPCLSYNDVKEEMRCQVSQQGILQSIYHIVKSRI